MDRRIFSLLIFLLVGTVNIFGNPMVQPVSNYHQIKTPGEYRLPTSTKPINYEIHLTTNIHKGDFDFTGNVKITLEAAEDTDTITIHSRQLTIEDDFELRDNEEKIMPVTKEYDDKLEFLTFKLKDEGEDAKPRTLKAGGPYTLEINYKGKLREDNGGFYRSSYTNLTGTEIWLATTQFESTDARHAFPCYDEPGIRATYDISITHGENYNAISNMPEKSRTTPTDGMVTTTFETIQSMQTYLVAFIVSDFDSITSQVSGRVMQGIFARPEYIHNDYADFGLQAGNKVLQDIQDYFGQKYDLPKMDQISVPDFQAGAMENWGLVTYREELLMYHPSTSSLNQKRRIAEVIAHEFVHQFFGNRVAPKWWDVLWLNEGFANRYEYYITQRVYPEFRTDDIFIFENLHAALAADALETTRPMTHYVESPTDIRNLFDSVAYDKSGSVLRMLQHSITDKTWVKGLSGYLDQMKFSAAVSDDLANSLNQAITEDKIELPKDKTMKHILDSWATQAGYPVINVNRLENNTLNLSQTKFSYKVPEEVPKEDNLWIIPINLATGSLNSTQFDTTTPNAWMTEKTHNLVSTDALKWDANTWVLLNKQQTGYYRVNYDAALWKLLTTKLNSKTFTDIHHINRAQLVDDVLNLARANLQSYPTAFDLLKYLKQEKDFTAWTSASIGLGYLNRMLSDSKNFAKFHKFVLELVRPIYATYGTHDLGSTETLADKHLRNIAIDWACLTGEQKCLDETSTRVRQIINNNSLDIEPDVRYNVYCSGLRKANVNEYNSVWNRFNATTNQADRTTLINSMGCVENKDIQKIYLESTINEKKNDYRVQERNRVLQGVYSNGKVGLESAMAFMKVNHKQIEADYNPPSPVKNSIIRMAERVTSENHLKTFTELVDEMVKEGYLTTPEKNTILETPKENIKWIIANDAEIGKYLNNGIIPSVSIFSLALVFIISFLFN